QVNGLQILVDQYLAASRPTRVKVQLGDGEPFESAVDAEGYVRFAATSTRSLRVTVQQVETVTTIDPQVGVASPLPAGLSELRLRGADTLRTPVDGQASTGVPCGFGPDLVVD